MPRSTTTRIPGPPAGGRTPYLDHPLETLPDGRTITVAERIIDAVRAGNYLETAAALAGVPIGTLRTWIRNGNATLRALHDGTPSHDFHRNDIRYAEFSHALTRAQAESEAEDVARLQVLARGAAKATKSVTTQKRNAQGVLLEETTRTEEETLPPDGAALRFRLGARFPARWAGTQRVELTGEDGGPVELTVAEKRSHLLEVLGEIAEERARDADEFAPSGELEEATG